MRYSLIYEDRKEPAPVMRYVYFTSLDTAQIVRKLIEKSRDAHNVELIDQVELKKL